MLVIETVLVLLLSLGASAIYSVLDIMRRLSSPVALGQQTSNLNTSHAEQPWLDLIYEIVQIGLGLVPVLLVCYLLARELPSAVRYLGIDRARPLPDLLLGMILAACIGLPGLALYVGARDAGLNTTVVAADLGSHWWVVPILVLSAVQNAALEETVMVGYLFTRWSQAGWRLWVIVVVSAVIRGSYHLYQGFGGFAGNIVMGLILGSVYLRTRRVLPLIITHSILDTVAFVGYALLHSHVSWL
nr:type II CAAX endopeptidase family protein [Leekyejoonella antrihumi]